LLIDAGLAGGVDMTHQGSTSPEARLTKLTWNGHEFAAVARDDTRWKQAMGMVKEKGGSITLAVLTQVLTHLMRVAFGV
jgi:hypothetical protein